MSVVYKEQEYDDLPLLVVAGNGPTLLGRDWLERIRLDWHNLYQVRPQSLVEGVLLDYQQLFEESLGTLNGYRASFQVDPVIKPKFCKARTVPYAICSLVEEELDRLISSGTLEPVPSYQF